MTKQTTKLEIFTEKSKLTANKQQTIDVLLRITPPELERSDSKRPKLNLSVVLDRSGSMEGEKMRFARKAAQYCIDQLLPPDRLSAVIFDDVVEVLIPSQYVENKEFLKRQIDAVNARNSTALHEAWVRGGLEVSKELSNEAINRVLLITDGLANVGETNTDRIVSQAQQLAAKGVNTSTIGIGSDFNEDLLVPMAEAGGGNAWHVEKADDMTRIFSVELEGLIAQTGHSVTLGIKTVSGATIADLLNDFEADEIGRYKLPNLQAAGVLDVVFQVRVPAHEAGEKIKFADFDITYIGQHSKLPEKEMVSLELEFDSESPVEALPVNLEVIKAVQLLMNARARQEAMDRMDRHDYAGAKSALKQASAGTQVLFSMAPNAEVEKEMNALREQESALEDRSEDKMSRKRMAYAAYSRKRGK